MSKAVFGIVFLLFMVLMLSGCGLLSPGGGGSSAWPSAPAEGSSVTPATKVCPVCKGSGKQADGYFNCAYCGGTGRK